MSMSVDRKIVCVCVCVYVCKYLYVCVCVYICVSGVSLRVNCIFLTQNDNDDNEKK